MQSAGGKCASRDVWKRLRAAARSAVLWVAGRWSASAPAGSSYEELQAWVAWGPRAELHCMPNRSRTVNRPAGNQDYHAYVRQKTVEHMQRRRGDFAAFLGALGVWGGRRRGWRIF